MLITSLKSKIHCAKVTEANLEYMGSITIDKELLKAAKIAVNEKVQIVNKNNGSRLETYVIEGMAGSGVVCLNGAAARLVQPGDIVIIIAYAQMTEAEQRSYTPTVVMVDADNKIKEIRHLEQERQVR